MCIYYGNLTELTYKPREHILSAALGCLENGVVSDQANKIFLPYRYNKDCGYIPLLVKIARTFSPSYRVPGILGKSAFHHSLVQ